MNSSTNVNAWSFAVLRMNSSEARICEEIVENVMVLKLEAFIRTHGFLRKGRVLAVNVLGGDEESFNSFKVF